jgi:pimeloyl-ACP methyl ester carboxylesterase
MGDKGGMRTTSLLSLLCVGALACAAEPDPSLETSASAEAEDVEDEQGLLVPPTYFALDTGEVTLNVRRDGDSGSPVVLLHGFPEGADDWDAVARRLGHRHTVYAPDLRGYNLSDRPAEVEAYVMEKLVADVEAVVTHAADQTGEAVVLVGHDWGAVPAFVFAHQRPDLVRGLVIINGIQPDLLRREIAANPLQRQALSYVNLFSQPGFEAVLAADDFKLLIDAFVDAEGNQLLTPEEQARYRVAWGQPGALTGMLNWYRANMVPDPTFETGPTFADTVPVGVTVDAPALILWGEQEVAFMPGVLEGLEEFVPDVTVIGFPDSGHWIIHEQPRDLNREIRRFVRSLQ